MIELVVFVVAIPVALEFLVRTESADVARHHGIPEEQIRSDGAVGVGIGAFDCATNSSLAVDLSVSPPPSHQPPGIGSGSSALRWSTILPSMSKRVTLAVDGPSCMWNRLRYSRVCDRPPRITMH